uniref:Sleeping Beauty transposase HTH domain-containing protein n=1 Tax=Esox lucius TaxID=8010 RepID=A0AAY5L7C1_ESOLU
MGSGKQFSEVLKQKILNFHKAGEGYKKISKRLGIPLPTMKTIVQKWKENGHYQGLVDQETPQNILQRSGLFGRKSHRKPLLTSGHKVTRFLHFCYL